MAAPASTVQVYVCDYNGIAQLVEVPVGTTLMKLVRVALQEPGFKEGDFLGFEDRNLAQDQLVTAADATRWTAEKPLKLKYKVRTRNQNNIRAMDVLTSYVLWIERRFVCDLVNNVETELEEKSFKVHYQAYWMDHWCCEYWLHDLDVVSSAVVIAVVVVWDGSSSDVPLINKKVWQPKCYRARVCPSARYERLNQKKTAQATNGASFDVGSYLKRLFSVP
ncbi:hypothetical protein DVH05_021478 [Phytophthora capsici]|nr:hypothetical protein DVH05_021478 [Phytophthora capsici]